MGKNLFMFMVGVGMPYLRRLSPNGPERSLNALQGRREPLVYFLSHRRITGFRGSDSATGAAHYYSLSFRVNWESRAVAGISPLSHWLIGAHPFARTTLEWEFSFMPVITSRKRASIMRYALAEIRKKGLARLGIESRVVVEQDWAARKPFANAHPFSCWSC